MLQQNNHWLIESQFRKQLSVMLEMQDAMNKMVFPDWQQRKLGWHRAIYVEAAEYLEHLGTWKWWKKGTPDFPQANLELVDIWHFGLSWYMDFLEAAPDDERLIDTIVAQVKTACGLLPSAEIVGFITPEMRHIEVDNLVSAAAVRRFDIAAFVRLLCFSGVSFDMLYQHYVGKNMLNRFRQDNGYKQGKYVKVWGELEDNVHLTALLEDLPLDEQLPVRIYEGLEVLYRQLTAQEP